MANETVSTQEKEFLRGHVAVDRQAIEVHSARHGLASSSPPVYTRMPEGWNIDGEIVREGENAMRKITLVSVLLLTGCGSTPQPYLTKDYALGEIRTTKTGAVMVSWEEGKRESEKGPVMEGKRRELVYNGISDSTLYVGFREYLLSKADPTALHTGPALSSELKYSLRGNRTVVFRDLRFTIEEVSPEFLRFTVAGDFKEPVPESQEAPAKRVPEPPDPFPK
jgi:hypothetical protein